MRHLKIKKVILFGFFLAVCCEGIMHAQILKVVTTTPDLAALAREVGSSKVEVQSLASSFQDPHFVDAKPSMIVKLMKADLFIETGLDLEIGWAPLLVQSSGNRKIQKETPGFLDASKTIAPLEIPQNPSRAMGDVHPGGNPHYLLDPENGKLVARAICEKLSELSPKDSELFKNNLARFESRLNQSIQDWLLAVEPYHGATFVGYHKIYTYFVKRFGLIAVGDIEPRPGIPPTALHTAELIEFMKEKKTRLIFTEPWYEARTPGMIAGQTGATVLEIALFPEGGSGFLDYIGMVDYNVKSILKILAK